MNDLINFVIVHLAYHKRSGLPERLDMRREINVSRFLGFDHTEEKAGPWKVYLNASPAKQLATCLPTLFRPLHVLLLLTYPGRTNRLIGSLSRAKNMDVNRLMHLFIAFFL